MHELVYITGEDHPRLRTGGRLVWLGGRDEVTNYHDPEADSETRSIGPDADDGEYEETDSSKWCPPLPDGVFIFGTMALPTAVASAVRSL